MDVLVVEDEAMLREAIAERLGDEGLSVAEAEAAEEMVAVASRADGPPPVVVTDIELGPGMDGLALGAELRRRWPGIGIIYVTGRPSRLSGHALGTGERFLPKPFALAALTRAVRDPGAARLRGR